MRPGFYTTFAAICGFLVLHGTAALAVDDTVTVSASQTMTQASMQGFLNGYTSVPASLTGLAAGLKPALWRLGFGWDMYKKAKALSPAPKVEMVLSDMYAGERGGYQNAAARPWMDTPARPANGNQPAQPALLAWGDWEKFCRDQVKRSQGVLETFNDGPLPVEYWDIWSEPDIGANWQHDPVNDPPGGPQDHTQDWANVLETYKRCYNAIKAQDPLAVVVGPGTTAFDSVFFNAPTKGLKDFLRELSGPPYNVRLEAVSWHEIPSLPSSLPAHAQELRDYLADTTKFPPLYQPQLHVNEYAAPDKSQIPGWIVGWLHYAEQADIDWFSKACWSMTDAFVTAYLGEGNWSNCVHGLGGLYMRNLVTPQQPYYVHKAYAEVNDLGTRLVTTSTNSLVTALAGWNDGIKTIKVMVGSHQAAGNPRSVDVRITNFPYGIAAGVTVRKLANNNAVSPLPYLLPIAQAAVYPTVSYSGIVPVSGGTLTVNIPSFANGEMYVIEARQVTLFAPGVATAPLPATGTADVPNKTILQWTAGANATSHDVYFGTTNPPPFRRNQTTTTFDPDAYPGAMLGTQPFYWRIDERNAAGVTTGPVWSLTAMPLAHPVVLASVTAALNPPAYVSGNLASIQTADDNNNFVVAQYGTPVVVNGELKRGTVAEPSLLVGFHVSQTSAQAIELAVRMKSKDSSTMGTGGMLRSISLMNWDLNEFERVGASQVTTTPSMWQVQLRGNVGRFISPGQDVLMVIQHYTDYITLPLVPHSMYVDYAIVRVNGEIGGAY